MSAASRYQVDLGTACQGWATCGRCREALEGARRPRSARQRQCRQSQLLASDTAQHCTLLNPAVKQERHGSYIGRTACHKDCMSQDSMCKVPVAETPVHLFSSPDERGTGLLRQRLAIGIRLGHIVHCCFGALRLQRLELILEAALHCIGHRVNWYSHATFCVLSWYGVWRIQSYSRSTGDCKHTACCAVPVAICFLCCPTAASWPAGDLQGAQLSMCCRSKLANLQRRYLNRNRRPADRPGGRPGAGARR